MKEFRDMTRITDKFHDKIQSFCSPLVQTFGISQFFHARVTNSGQFTGVNLSKSWEEYFLSEKSNLLHWPDECDPCKIRNGVRLLQENEDEGMNKLLRKAREGYSINFSLQFVEKTGQCANTYGFALNSSNPFQHMMLIKEMPLLRLFIKRFHEEFKELYNALENNKVDMLHLLGTSFQKMENPAIIKSVALDQFLKKIGISIPESITDREFEVMKYLIKACPASQIASAMFISKRTVEHHIERIKDKFRSSSKSELVQKLRELESIGCFMF